MTFKQFLMVILLINFNPLGLWLNVKALENFLPKQTENIQQHQEDLPESCRSHEIEQVNQ